jgi:hypothetical protein
MVKASTVQDLIGEGGGLMMSGTFPVGWTVVKRNLDDRGGKPFPCRYTTVMPTPKR